MSASDAHRLKELETENARPKKLLAESTLEIEAPREALRKMWYAHPSVKSSGATCQLAS